MTRDREIERVLDHWFQDGPSVIPERLMDVVLDRVDRTPQRRLAALLARSLAMPPILRAGVLAAAVLVAVVAGISVLNPNPGPGTSPTPSPTPSPAASPSPTVAPSPSPLAYEWPRALAPGTYTTSLIWTVPVVATFTVPDGWESRDVEIISDRVAVMFGVVDNVFADPCSGVLRDPPIGSSVDDLVDALAALPGIDATPPEPTELAGFAGKLIELTVREDAGCGLSEFQMWTTRIDWMKAGQHTGGTVFWAEHEHYRIWVLEVDGVRYFIAGISASAATPAELAELQSVIDSIRLGT